MRKSFVVLLALTCLGLTTAQAHQSPDGDRAAARSNLRVAVVAKSPAAVRSYWTPERMEAAIPVDLEASSAVPAGTPVPDGEPGRVEETAPAGDSRAASTARGSGIWLESPVASYERPGSYTAFPNSTNGKVFFHNPNNGFDYVCSATSLTSDNHSLAWTAGHCVVDPGAGFFTNWLFVPAFRDGSKPLGQWPALEYWVYDNWSKSGDYSYDMAAVVVAPNGAGDRLTDVTGGRGFAWNLNRDQEYEAIGYPAVSPFNGNRMMACLSPFAGRGLNGENTIGIRCDMTPGSSGGGWIVDDEYVNSNTSYGYVELPGVLYGPYLNDDAALLYDAASESEAPGPDPEPDPLTHGTSITLVLKKKLVAKGSLNATDGFLSCESQVSVRVERKTSSGWKKAGKTTTESDGSYKVQLENREGKYRAVAAELAVDQLNVCAEAISKVEKH